MSLRKRLRLPKIKHFFQNRALVLLYHRINVPMSDPWSLSVSPVLFEKQLQYLKNNYSIISSDELAVQMASGKIRDRSVVLTFDDGYLDNYETARPLLEKHSIPATFFITDSYMDSEQPFWWDELEYVIVHSNQLPSIFSISFNNKNMHFDLSGETVLDDELRQKQQNYKAHNPPTLRTELYLALWRLFSPLQKTEQQNLLRQIREWAGLTAEETRVGGCMSGMQLQALSENALFTIGGHSKSHLSLDCHSEEVQEVEISENKQFLEDLVEKRVHHFSYPSGKYGDTTVKLLKNNDFHAAFTGDANPVDDKTDHFEIPRCQVNDWGVEKFKRKMEKWFTS